MNRVTGKPTICFLNRSDRSWSISPQKMARSWKFWIFKVEDLYYSRNRYEKKGTDQLHGYCEADLRLCFQLQIVGFLTTQLE